MDLTIVFFVLAIFVTVLTAAMVLSGYPPYRGGL